MQVRRRQDEVFTERSAQIRNKEEVQCMQQEEDRVFAQMWESDWLAKEERHKPGGSTAEREQPPAEGIPADTDGND